MKVVLLLGTRKGLFIAESDARRDSWSIRGPLISGTWAILHAAFDSLPCGPETVPTIFAGGASNWYGAAVWRSRDLGRTWTHSSEGLSYGDTGPEIRQVWRVTPAVDSSGRRVLYAGVEPAGLFRSGDDGESCRRTARASFPVRMARERGRVVPSHDRPSSDRSVANVGGHFIGRRLSHRG